MAGAAFSHSTCTTYGSPLGLSWNHARGGRSAGASAGAAPSGRAGCADDHVGEQLGLLLMAEMTELAQVCHLGARHGIPGPDDRRRRAGAA